MSRTLVIRASGCPACNSLKSYLAELKEPFQIDTTLIADDNMDFCRQHKITSVPALVVDGRALIGYHEIVEYINTGAAK